MWNFQIFIEYSYAEFLSSIYSGSGDMVEHLLYNPIRALHSSKKALLCIPLASEAQLLA